MADITLPSPTTSKSAGKLRGAYFCYFLAALVMLATAWFILEGIQATEPDSPARSAKVASGILLLFLEGCVFSLAGTYKEHAFILRMLGWAIFVLQITLMTLANYSIGATAGKSAAITTATISQVTAQADALRETGKSLKESADKLNKSKHGWLNSQGGQNATAAAKQTAAAGDAVEKLDELKTKVSTPLIETLGPTWFLVLSCAWSLILELAGMALMHVAGSLRHEAAAAASGGVPVELQILALLQEMRRAPAAPAPKARTKAIEAPQAAQEDPAEDDTAPAPARAPAAPAGDEKPAFGFIPATSKLSRFDTPPVNVNTPRKEYFSSGRGINDDTPPLSTLTPPEPHRGINVDTPNDTPTKARKQRQARDGLPMDSGTGPHDGYRYRRALEGVKAHTIRPSLSGLYQGVGATADVARRFIAAMAAAGEIVRNEEDTAWIPAPKKAARKPAKKGGAA
jgi:hypothetical protein